MRTRILVVGASLQTLELFSHKVLHHDTVAASDEREALKVLTVDQNIVLIIIDLGMPDDGAFELLRKIRADDRLHVLRTIILTQSDEPEREITGLRLGATDYLRKPLHPENLQTRITMHMELLGQQRLEQQYAKQHVLTDALFWQAPVGIMLSHDKQPISGARGEPFEINPAFAHICGWSKEALEELGWASITHPDDLTQELELLQKLCANTIPEYSLDKRFIRPDGSIIWVHMVVSSLSADTDYRFNFLCIIQDITSRKLLESSLAESERSKSVLLSNLPGMAYRCAFDPQWTMKFVSDGCLSLTGYTAEQLIGNRDLSFNDLIA